MSNFLLRLSTNYIEFFFKSFDVDLRALVLTLYYKLIFVYQIASRVYNQLT